MTKKLLFLLVLLGASFAVALAQDRKVSGTVKDAKGEALPGVSIRETGTNNGTASDAEGKFALTLKGTNSSLEFTFMGYAKTVVKADRDVIRVVMQADAQSLKDVVVVGYQTMTRKTSTTAISTVKGDVVENLPAPSFESLLQGRVTGVNVQNFTGEPGVRNTFVIRGNSRVNLNMDEARALSSPLYVIDGVPINVDDMLGFDGTQTNSIAGINPNDIEDMQVLKDAAATSIWGSRGANGVIVIKTRRGKEGKPEFRFNYYQGMIARPRLLETVTGTEERRQKLALLNEYAGYVDKGKLPVVLTDSLNPSFNNAVDWQDLFLRSGSLSNADFAVSNGNDKMNYRISANYYSEDGVVRNTGFNRYALRGNLNFRFSDKISGYTNLSLSRMDRKRGLGKDRYESPLPVDLYALPSSLLYVTPEKIKAYTDQYDKLRDININDQIVASLGLTYNIVKGLEYRFMGSANVSNNRRDFFMPSDLDADGVNRASSYNAGYNSYYLDNSLSYRLNLTDDHHFYLTGGQSFQRDVANKMEGIGYNLPSDDIQVIGNVAQQDKRVYSDYSASGLLSWFGQMQYDYKEKYLLSASYRADASSRFGPDTKWGKFYSVGAGYVISEEKFFQPISSVVNYMKFRGSYGTSGEQFSEFYAPFNRFTIPGYYNGTAAYLPDYEDGYGITKKNFTWSNSRQFNFGFESFLFKNNRISLTVDYYEKLSGRDFNTFEMPFWAGYNKLTANYDINVRNRGFEVTIITKNLPEKSKLKWSTNLNFSVNKNQITKLPYNNKTFYRTDGFGIAREYTIGKPTYVMAQMQYGGVYNNYSQIPFNPVNGQLITYFKGNNRVRPGYPVWHDLNGDWDVWSDEDRGDPNGDLTATGDPNPRVTGGFVNDFQYKNWTLSIATTFTLGRDIINMQASNELDNTFRGGAQGFAARRLPNLDKLNYWKPSELDKQGEGYSAEYPAMSPYGYFYQFLPFSDMFNEDGSYLKVKFISLGYNVASSLTRRLKISNVRIYGTVDNLLMFQRADVPDAEQVNVFGVYNGSGNPIPRKFTMGMDVKF